MIVVGVTGSTGAMGEEVINHLISSPLDIKVKAFIHNRKKRSFSKSFKRMLRKYPSKIELIQGDLDSEEDVIRFVKDTKYIIHCGALIPPRSDHNPQKTYKANYIGTKNLVDAVKKIDPSIYFIHISTVAVYSNRTEKHPWARVGDPVISSAYDYYSYTKIKAERCVLESGLPNFLVLRQTAVYHKYFMSNNLHDGLMFHTCWNAPLEWVTDSDSGVLFEHLIKKNEEGKLPNGFFKKIYDIGGGDKCRETGYETFNSGFALMGATAKDFFKPNWNIPRNFHGVWFEDSDELNDILDFRSETSENFWKKMRRRCWYYNFGRILPKALLRKIVIERLLSTSNSPTEWVRENNKGRIDAFFHGLDNYKKIPSSWDDYPLVCEGDSFSGKVNYSELKKQSNAYKYRLDHGYDESKKDEDLDIEDMKKAAIFRGGECLSDSMVKGDLYTKLKWRCHEGHEFMASPYTILKGGFWCPDCEPLPWTYDKQAKYNKFLSQVYYDSHSEDENNTYPYDEKKDNKLMSR